MRSVTLPEGLGAWRDEFIIKSERLLRIVGRYLTEQEVQAVKEACVYGAFAHDGQFRSSGEPYIFHPLAVALILTEVQIDAPSIIGGILHDVIEDTPITFSEIESRFGEDVATIVDGVTKLTQIKFTSKEEEKAENFRKMILAMTKDIRVIMVKLADRLHNMRTLGALEPYKKRRIANDTLEVYAPIAARLGIYDLQVQLENLCFKNLHPWRYRVLKAALDEQYRVQENNLDKIKERLDEALVQLNVIARISTRRKHLWSIYSKVRVKGRLNLVYDIFAIRIIVRSVDDCYRALGVVHRHLKPIMGGFKDYIAIPKTNGYQSLHTIVFGANNLPVEVQIRTRDMHIIAEAGAAAHWRYKEVYEHQEHNYDKTTEWLDSVMEIQDSALTSKEFMETMKADFFPKEIYVFTPNGKIIELPRGATAIDFAYSVHSDIGNRSAAAYVDMHEVALTQPLSNGQTVRIEVSDDAFPSPMWLEHAVTARARTRIRAYLRSLKEAEAEALGRSVLEEALQKRGIDLSAANAEDEAIILSELGLESKEALLRNIGRGKYPPQYVINRFLIHQREHKGLSEEEQRLLNVSQDAIIGAEGMNTSLAPCCHPLPGEPIMGCLTIRHGLMIHLVGCMNMQAYKDKPEKCIPLEWSKEVRGEFPVKLYLVAKNQRGSLAAISARLTEMQLDIDEFNSTGLNEDLVRVEFVIKVSDRKHLADIMRELKLLSNVERVSRK